MLFLPKQIKEHSFNVKIKKKTQWLAIFLQPTAIFKYQQATLFEISYQVCLIQQTKMKNVQKIKTWFTTI